MISDRPNPQRGFTYLGVMFVVVALGISLAATGELWSTTHQRDREEALLFAGDQIRAALVSYREHTPGKRLPGTLDELLADRRNVVIRRHLRRLYLDPMTHGEWALLRLPDGQIVGVYSTSTRTPIKRGGFPQRYAGFSEAKTYQDWVFSAQDDSASTRLADVRPGR